MMLDRSGMQRCSREEEELRTSACVLFSAAARNGEESPSCRLVCQLLNIHTHDGTVHACVLAL